MSFDPKKLKYTETLPEGSKGYHYKNTTVTNGTYSMPGVKVRMVSIGTSKPGLPKEEVDAMLKYFGFDLDKYIQEQHNIISYKYMQIIE